MSTWNVRISVCTQAQQVGDHVHAGQGLSVHTGTDSRWGVCACMQVRVSTWALISSYAYRPACSSAFMHIQHVGFHMYAGQQLSLHAYTTREVSYMQASSSACMHIQHVGVHMYAGQQLSLHAYTTRGVSYVCRPAAHPPCIYTPYVCRPAAQPACMYNTWDSYVCRPAADYVSNPQ